MQNLLRRQMGIDAYGMDRDDEVLWESLLERPRNPAAAAAPRKP
ncbi:MAG: hypothetical protein QOD77_470 [Thermoplasmata archaeon]|nr:hypothetical protein [Thermoplasmata archaeon]